MEQCQCVEACDGCGVLTCPAGGAAVRFWRRRRAQVVREPHGAELTGEGGRRGRRGRRREAERDQGAARSVQLHPDTCTGASVHGGAGFRGHFLFVHSQFSSWQNAASLLCVSSRQLGFLLLWLESCRGQRLPSFILPLAPPSLPLQETWTVVSSPSPPSASPQRIITGSISTIQIR